MRLIDADALKKAILGHCRSEIEATNHFWYDDTIIALIDNAPTVEPFERIGAICNENCGYKPQGEWIMLSEKQPPESGYYITSTIYNQVYCDYWSVDHFDRTETVVAWQPLPKPYKKGGAE